MKLILLFSCFFPAALPRQSFFYALLLAGLKVEGVTLNLLDDVFRLHLTLKTAERVLKGLALLNSNFSQTNYTPKLVPFGPVSYCKVHRASQVLCNFFVHTN